MVKAKALFAFINHAMPAIAAAVAQQCGTSGEPTRRYRG
jgi:hypothetical protein